MTRPRLTLALAAFDRHMPFFIGGLERHPDFDLHPLDVGMTSPGRDGLKRHGRMLRDLEFDAAEVSFASYIMARRQGVPVTAVPIFPRRLFSQNCIYVRKDAGIRAPADLWGRRIAIRGFQVTLSVLAKGDLKRWYGVDWRSIHWFTQEPETIAWSPPPGVRVEPITDGRRGADLLVAGEVDALFDPRPPETMLATGKVRPLFDDPPEESARYFRQAGYFPIMHVLAIKDETIARHPSLPDYLVRVWEEAKRQTRKLYDDPAFSLMPSGIYAFARERERYGDDPWPSGLAANRANIEAFIGYLRDQTLLDEAVDVPGLFAESTRK